MAMILDSSPLVADERGRFDLVNFLQTRNEPVVISAITASELLHGCHRAPDARRREKRMEYVERTFRRFEAVPFTVSTARVHARIWAELVSAGVTIGDRDLLIGATAILHDLTLATLNFADFARIPGLKLVEQAVMASFEIAQRRRSSGSPEHKDPVP